MFERLKRFGVKGLLVAYTLALACLVAVPAAKADPPVITQVIDITPYFTAFVLALAAPYGAAIAFKLGIRLSNNVYRFLSGSNKIKA